MIESEGAGRQKNGNGSSMPSLSRAIDAPGRQKSLPLLDNSIHADGKDIIRYLC